MVKLSAFRQYGSRTNSDLDFSSVKVENLDSKKELEEAHNTTEQPTVSFEVQKDNDLRNKPGRPVENPGLNLKSRTYKIAEPALDAMEEKFFEMRKEWSDKMSFSKYLTNLIWQDTHNGALLYDPVTGELIKENLK